MPASPLILIVDDEPDLVAPLAFALSRDGFATRTALDGASAIAAARTPPLPDLVLLDLMLPDMPGTEVFRRLRNHAETAALPVIIVSARGEEASRIIGLELGADDYVTKPYNTRELLLRVRAVLRRAAAQTRPPPELPPATEQTADAHTFGLLRLDPEAHRAWVDGQEVGLTAHEYRLLLTLTSRRGRVQTRDQLLAAAWEDGTHVGDRTIDTHVKRLRRKLGKASSYVSTVRGVGYRFECP